MSKSRSFSRCWVVGLGTLVVLTACGEPAPENGPEESISAAPALTLADVEGLGVPNASMPLPNLLAAGQPSEEQTAALIEMGYTNFVSLRPPSENGAGWEESRITGMGDDISFARIPVRGSDGLTRENVEALDRILDEAAAENTVLYCASSNRVGGLLALRAAWLDGASPEEALALGRAAGLRSLEPAVAELLAEGR